MQLSLYNNNTESLHPLNRLSLVIISVIMQKDTNRLMYFSLSQHITVWTMTFFRNEKKNLTLRNNLTAALCRDVSNINVSCVKQECQSVTDS